MEVLMAVPWRGGQADRERNWAYCKEYYPSYWIEELDSNEDPFNRGHSQNLALNFPWDVVIVMDADCLVPHPQLQKAVRLAYETGCLVQPHTNFSPLTEEETASLLSGNMPSPTHTTRTAAGGCHVMNRETFIKLGGYDGDYAPRGQDGRILRQALIKRVRVVKVAGPMLHLYHARPDKAVAQQAAFDRIAQYDPHGGEGMAVNSKRWLAAVRAAEQAEKVY